MKWPSLSFIISQIFLGYMLFSIYSLSLLFVPPPCERGEYCFSSYLSKDPKLGLRIFTSVTRAPFDREASVIHTIDNFDYTKPQNIPLILHIPRKTQDNGTLFMHFILSGSKMGGKSFSTLLKDPLAMYTTVKMTRYAIPEAEVFKLLGHTDSNKEKKEINVLPVSHLKSKISFTIMTDNIELPMQNLPLELLDHIKVTQNMFLPIITYDFLQTRHRDLSRITPENSKVNITVSYMPISIGKLRLMLLMETSMQGLKSLGFSDKDMDEVKGIFADTNIYLLGGTFFIAVIHLLFDFLAFKNDVNFWRRKDNLAGLSMWAVAWRAFSQSIIFLYLLDEGSSLLVLIPAGIGTVIEIWKLKKILRVDFVRDGSILPRMKFNKNTADVVEKKTREFDAESMRYLSYLLYPLVVVGAIHSLLYQPHKSWYSWSIHSLANGVYAFGFLFMLPQLFVNYKLKSVAHLPWRAFMYKAFNTFIDDVFAFIITMPTAHRIACFRDDAVFLVYLYQRWLYPVDKSRIDTGTMSEQTVDLNSSDKKTD